MTARSSPRAPYVAPPAKPQVFLANVSERIGADGRRELFAIFGAVKISLVQFDGGATFQWRMFAQSIRDDGGDVAAEVDGRVAGLLDAQGRA